MPGRYAFLRKYGKNLFGAAAVLAAAGLLFGCVALPVGTDSGESDMDEEPEITGGHTSRTDRDAAHETESDDLTYFHLSFYDGRTGGHEYEVRVSGEDGSAVLAKGDDAGREDPETPLELSAEEVAGLQKIIRDYELAALNGIWEETAGLPDCDGDFEIRAEYASGEKISGYSNGGSGGLQREGFDAVRNYLEPFFIRNGDIGEIMDLYPLRRACLFVPESLPVQKNVSTLTADISPYGGWKIRLWMTDKKGELHSEQFRLTDKGMESLTERILYRVGAQDLPAIPFEKGEGMAEDAIPFAESGFSEETGEEILTFRADPEKEVLLDVDHEDDSGVPAGYFFYQGAGDRSAERFAAIAADELLNLISERECLDSIKSITYVNEVPDYKETGRFSYTLEKAPDGRIRISGSDYRGYLMMTVTGENLPVEESSFEDFRDEITGFGLTRQDPDGIPERVREGDDGEDLFTITYGDGTVFSKSLGSKEKDELRAQLYILLVEGLEATGQAEGIR